MLFVVDRPQIDKEAERVDRISLVLAELAQNSGPTRPARFLNCPRSTLRGSLTRGT
jgi:hypothetical protein